MCKKDKDLLIRCMIDDTNKWYMVCGKCWKNVSGGVVDGDSNHPLQIRWIMESNTMIYYVGMPI